MSDVPEAEVIKLACKLDEAEARVAALERLCDAKARELIAHREKQHGNYWAWQGDGNDHLESLSYACPVVISAVQLQAILAMIKEAETSLDKLARLGNEPHFGNSTGNVIAQHALAAITLPAPSREAKP